MKKLIVHIGHGKTGSSFLQSSFALNREKLKQLGILYPEHKSDDRAKQGAITSGNGELLFKKNDFDNTYPSTLFSDERLFRELVNKKESIASLSKRFNLEIVIYLRDVIEHRVSQWHQFIKHHGGYKDLNTFLLTKEYDVLNIVLKWIKLSDEIGFKLSLRNYSKCKDVLLQDFFSEVLMLPDSIDNLILPSSKVNRSLTHTELDIQRVFNLVYGKESSRYISDFVCNNFPNLEPWKPSLTEDIYEKTFRKNIQSLDAINLVLDESMHLEIGRKEIWVNGETEGSIILENDMCIKLAANIREAVRTLDSYTTEVDLRIQSMVDEGKWLDALKLTKRAIELGDERHSTYRRASNISHRFKKTLMLLCLQQRPLMLK